MDDVFQVVFVQNKEFCNNVIASGNDYNFFNLIKSQPIIETPILTDTNINIETNVNGKTEENSDEPKDTKENDDKDKEKEKEKSPISKKSCDVIFVEYLRESAFKANHSYFSFLFKFVVLFRECMNKFKPGETFDELKEKEEKEYTQYKNAESCPDLCNEFITDFLECANYYGMTHDSEKIEFIEIIQHFCHWLFENSFTTSRLSLL